MSALEIIGWVIVGIIGIIVAGGALAVWGKAMAYRREDDEWLRRPAPSDEDQEG